MLTKYGSFQSPIKITIGVLLIIDAIVGFLAALTLLQKRVAFSYHIIHALAMLVYGISVLIFVNTFETLKYFSWFLFLFYAFSEIIFCSLIFNLNKEVVFKIVFVRLVLGLMVGIFTIVIMNYRDLSDIFVLKSYGLIFVVIGVNILLYFPVMKPKELDEAL